MYFKRYFKWYIMLFIMFLVLIVGLTTCNSNRQNSPTDVVIKNLESKKNNDYKCWKSTFYTKVQNSLFEKDGDLGVLSLTVENVEICNEETNRIIKMYCGSKLADSNGWSDKYIQENMIAVLSHYIVDYDNSKVPYNEGDIKQYFYLIRKNKKSPWLIWDTIFTN